MNKPDPDGLAAYYKAADSWADDRSADNARSTRTAWIIAGVAGAIALLEAIAIVVMMPLKTTQPIAVLVDKQTGNVEALDLGAAKTIQPDAALTRSMLAQYVIARENFDIGALKDNYRKVALWSAGEARDQYVSAMQASNPSSPLAQYPRQAVVRTEIRSISQLGSDTVLVRFAMTRTDPGGQPVPQGVWAAVVKYRFSAAGMSEESRLDNPLGFQVLRYSKSAEIASDPQALAPAPIPYATQPAPLPPASPLPPSPAPR
ncbi:MAG: virB8 family protein [Novosphingobium sp.]